MLQPNLAKVDLDLLITDIKKYQKAGLFSESVYLSWQQLLDNFPNEYGRIPQQIPEWPVGTILKKQNNDESVPEISLPPKIVELRQAEADPTEQVRIMYTSYICTNLHFDLCHVCCVHSEKHTQL